MVLISILLIYSIFKYSLIFRILFYDCLLLLKLEYKMMPPPKYGPVKKRKSKRSQDFGSSRGQQAASQPTTPLLQGKISRQNQTVHRRPTSTMSVNSVASNIQQNDSDSDTACGFDSAWRGSAQL